VALTDNQRAMLRLLAQSDESYEDIAALKGVGVEQVKQEVKAALAAAAAEGVSAAEPTAEESVVKKPAAEKPVAPPPPKERAAKPQPAPRARRPRGSLPPERRRFLVFAGGALAAVSVVLILVAALGGGSDGSGSQAGEGTGQTASAENAKLTQAKLEAVGGGDAEGQAVFGRLKKKIILLVEAVGLEPTPKGSSYTVWLYKSPELALRVGSVKVSRSGGIRAPFQLTPEIFGGVLGRVFDQIYVSRTDDAAYQREVEQAEKQKKLPAYTGETVLRGEITGPVVKQTGGGGEGG
jgi:hypothetical protein